MYFSQACLHLLLSSASFQIFCISLVYLLTAFLIALTALHFWQFGLLCLIVQFSLVDILDFVIVWHIHLSMCSLFEFVHFCILLIHACKHLISIFVNQEETSSCDLQRGRTNWFRPKLLMMSFNYLSENVLLIHLYWLLSSLFAGKYQLSKGCNSRRWRFQAI